MEWSSKKYIIKHKEESEEIASLMHLLGTGDTKTFIQQNRLIKHSYKYWIFMVSSAKKRVFTVLLYLMVHSSNFTGIFSYAVSLCAYTKILMIIMITWAKPHYFTKLLHNPNILDTHGTSPMPMCTCASYTEPKLTTLTILHTEWWTCQLTQHTTLYFYAS